MPDYQQGKIYTIRCRTDDTMIYVGSTIQPLAKRWGEHKRDSITERSKNRLIYQTINNDWENWYIELYDLYPCSCKIELCRKEGEVIRLIGTLNNNIAGRTQKEYYEEYNNKLKEYGREYGREHYKNNAEKKKEYIKNNADEIKEYQKEYYKNNADEMKEYQKEWNKNHVDKKKEYNKKHRDKKKAEKLNAINTP